MSAQTVPQKGCHDLADEIWRTAQHGYAVSHGVDWPQIIGFIDKFVSILDRALEWKPSPPANVKKVVDDRWKPYCAHIASLIKKAKENEDWTMDAADGNILVTLRAELLQDCQTWKFGSQFDEFTRTANPNFAWPPADYMRDLPTAQSRSAGQGSAVMKLRPQPRVKYTK